MSATTGVSLTFSEVAFLTEVAVFIWVWVDWMTSLPASTQYLSLPGSINGDRAKLRNNAKITGLLVKISINGFIWFYKIR